MGLSREEIIEAARRELEYLDRTDRRFWRPKDGENSIRIMPPVGDGLPWLRIGQHFSVGPGNETFACPKISLEEDCYLCRVVDELAATGDEADKEEADKLRVRRRWIMNIVDLSEPSKGTQIWAAGPQITHELLRYMGDPDWGDFSDPEDGLNIYITKTGAGLGTRYAMKLARRSSRFVPPEDYPDLLENLPDLTNVMDYASEEQMATAYQGYSPEADAPDGDDTTEPTASEAAPPGYEDPEDAPEKEEEAPSPRPVAPRPAPRATTRPTAAARTAVPAARTPAPRPQQASRDQIKGALDRHRRED